MWTSCSQTYLCRLSLNTKCFRSPLTNTWVKTTLPGFWGYVGPPLRWGCWEETEGARRYVPVADTMEAEEVVEELWREIWREMVPNWDMGMGPKPGPWGTEADDGATTREESRCEQHLYSVYFIEHTTTLALSVPSVPVFLHALVRIFLHSSFFTIYLILVWAKGQKHGYEIYIFSKAICLRHFFHYYNVTEYTRVNLHPVSFLKKEKKIYPNFYSRFKAKLCSV